MNSNVSSSKLNPVPRVSTLRPVSTENADVAEGALRLFLVLCLLASLALGGWHAEANNAASGNAHNLSSPAVTKVVPSVPSLPVTPYRVAAR